jgi:hypothetical protein
LTFDYGPFRLPADRQSLDEEGAMSIDVRIIHTDASLLPDGPALLD